MSSSRELQESVAPVVLQSQCMVRNCDCICVVLTGMTQGTTSNKYESLALLSYIFLVN